ncbi:hypothetical protein HYQ46_004253 [Verticillium longisporum]|nr:hypothetical protein HYQ46_004253 [Verticillium longisporum]
MSSLEKHLRLFKARHLARHKPQAGRVNDAHSDRNRSRLASASKSYEYLPGYGPLCGTWAVLHVLLVESYIVAAGSELAT